MSLRRWDPLRDLLTLQERMNRLFEESLSRLEDPLVPAGRFSPVADVLETFEAFLLEVELPGVAEEDVEVIADSEQLTLRGVRRAAAGLRPDSFQRVERSTGPFGRAFAFPCAVDPDRVRAQFVDGLLRIEVPKLRQSEA